MPASRFENILRGSCTSQSYDTVLWDLKDAVVSPTLGSIIPHWVLVIPRAPAINMAEWSKDRTAPLLKVEEVARLASRSTEDVIWFEHGAATTESITGCGVDHAHLHVLLSPPFSFNEFSTLAKASADLEWSEGAGNPYTSLAANESYLVAGQGTKYLVARNVEAAGSQFFRRVIASLTGKPMAWDYNKHPHLENVALTVGQQRTAA